MLQDKYIFEVEISLAPIYIYIYLQKQNICLCVRAHIYRFYMKNETIFNRTSTYQRIGVNVNLLYRPIRIIKI